MDVLARAGRLSESRRPFVLATVVWRRAPSSGRRGSRAIITAEGHLEGWLGGACAEPSLIRAALEVLDQGEPRLMFLGPADELGDHDLEGMEVMPMACENEGALEVYLEPVLPPPQVVVIGHSPAVFTLGRLVEGLGWQATLLDTRGHDEVDLGGLSVDEGTAVVVATQGHDDERALQAALATPAGYVGLVASAKRAHFVLEHLAGLGVADDDLERVHAPAGVDLGSTPNEEIAVSVLAELVQVRAAGGLRSAVDPDGVSDRLVTDPVCGMAVDPATSPHHVVHDGKQLWFCSAGCRSSFEADPGQYLDAR